MGNETKTWIMVGMTWVVAGLTFINQWMLLLDIIVVPIWVFYIIKTVRGE